MVPESVSKSNVSGISTGYEYSVHPVNTAVRLLPDADHYEPVIFLEKDTGLSHILYIKSVSLYDPYKEIREYLNTPGLDRDAQADICVMMTDHMMKHAHDAPRYEINYCCEDAQVVFSDRNNSCDSKQITSNPAFSNAIAFLGATVNSSSHAASEPNGRIGGDQTCLVQYKEITEGPMELFLDYCFTLKDS